ncbi:hypothetical protein PWT90_09624 [Aphanocladium album]|nr:hypothetical protein PWT90_09624 [Aphanocladium album]
MIQPQVQRRRSSDAFSWRDLEMTTSRPFLGHSHECPVCGRILVECASSGEEHIQTRACAQQGLGKLMEFASFDVGNFVAAFRRTQTDGVSCSASSNNHNVRKCIVAGGAQRPSSSSSTAGIGCAPGQTGPDCRAPSTPPGCDGKGGPGCPPCDGKGGPGCPPAVTTAAAASVAPSGAVTVVA